ncbi:MAG: IS1096 element passenger TnpR family protein [Sphingobacteriaceae bacterium]
MAVYRFRIAFEDFDEVIREIDIKSNSTFEELHQIIHQSTGYNSECSSSFYISNDQWMKGEEISYLPTQRKLDRGVSLMNKIKLSSFIDDPHQKFYYTYNFDRPYDFHIELMKIMLNEVAGINYPVIHKSTGEAPKPPGSVTNAVAAATANEDFDFLNEMGLGLEDTDELEGLTDVGETDSVEAASEEDEFDDEFSDNESFDSEESTSKDDY